MRQADRERLLNPDVPELYAHICNASCPAWDRCREEKLWEKQEALPCEVMLDSEMGFEAEPSELPVWQMPFEVGLRLDLVTSV